MFNKLKEFFRNTAFYPLYKKTRADFFRIINGNPQKDLFIIGVTGTDGKTTTVNLIQKILNDNLGLTASISTAQIKVGEEVLQNTKKMTSFDPKDLYYLLAEFKAKGVKYVVLEVSSHGLAQYRFWGIEFDMGVLTNISPEHLDYHRTLEDYAETKKKLFINILTNSKPIKYASFPKDDEWGRKWMEEFSFDKMIDWGIVSFATLRGENISESLNGLEFDVKYLGKYYHFRTDKLLGKHNVYNILAASSVGVLLGINLDNIARSIEKFEGLPGRLQKIEKNGKIWFVDFAHTPKALESVLSFLQKVKGNRKVITVFGAPGNRDKFKRPRMGEVVDKLSDIIILTDDDPDTEDRYKIIFDVSKGISRTEGVDYFIIPERSLAIKFADEISSEGDIILVAGKGHETIQLTNFGKRKWSDVEYINSL